MHSCDCRSAAVTTQNLCTKLLGILSSLANFISLCREKKKLPLSAAAYPLLLLKYYVCGHCIDHTHLNLVAHHFLRYTVAQFEHVCQRRYWPRSQALRFQSLRQCCPTAWETWDQTLSLRSLFWSKAPEEMIVSHYRWRQYQDQKLQFLNGKVVRYSLAIQGIPWVARHCSTRHQKPRQYTRQYLEPTKEYLESDGDP